MRRFLSASTWAVCPAIFCLRTASDGVARVADRVALRNKGVATTCHGGIKRHANIRAKAQVETVTAVRRIAFVIYSDVLQFGIGQHGFCTSPLPVPCSPDLQILRIPLATFGSMVRRLWHGKSQWRLLCHRIMTDGIGKKLAGSGLTR